MNSKDSDDPRYTMGFSEIPLLLNDIRNNIKLKENNQILDNIEKSLLGLQRKRDKTITDEQQELLKLSEKLAQHSRQVSDLENSNIKAQLKARIKNGQTQELEINKHMKELASLKQDLNASMGNLFDELKIYQQSIEEMEVLDDNAEKDATVLKVMLYRQMGLKADIKTSLLVIHNKEKNITDVLNYKDEKYSDYFISNYIWDRL